ncbi:GMC family oxidoreductase [Pseudonocardia sp.]|uniref:GMC family oxidoreductase n=1 Tax=Pseudonocardia sp. TaxID=60912 RepID=UPI003D140317
MPAAGFDVVVVGGGAAGCALAARLAADRRVLLLEAGPAVVPEALRAVASLEATTAGHLLNWTHAAQLRTGHAAVVPRGRVLGGSSAINGAVWMHATPADQAAWGLDLTDAYASAATDLDTGRGNGPVPVRRPAGPLRHPATDRFLAAADALGLPHEHDKNAGGPPGAGLVPSNTRDGRRVDAATAYLPGSGAEVRTDVTVRRVLLDWGRATGVELTDGARIHADVTVLAAGAVGTPHLLLASGIGPADELRAAGTTPRADLPVGRDVTDHPAVFLPFRAPAHTTDPPPHPHAPAAQAALDLDSGADPAGDVEVLLFARPFAPAGELHLMCLLQHPESRGAITLPAPAGPPRIEYRYLRTEYDRRRLRYALRTAAELLRAGLGERAGLDAAELATDRATDGWIAAHLTTAVHLCGGAAIGRVVDAAFRVLGIDGLRVADTSVLPVAPRRGPAATAVALGERAAELIRSG